MNHSYRDILQLSQPQNESRGNYSLQQNLTAGLGGFRRTSLRNYTSDSYTVNGALVNLWTQAVTSRQDYYAQSGEMRRFWLVDAMINLIATDVLNPDERGDIIKLTSQDPEIQEELKKFQRRFDFNILLKDITQDFIDFGEYTLRLEVEDGEGVKGIFDDVNQLNVVAMYEDGQPKRFISWDDNDFQIEPAHQYAHFVSGSERMRVRLEVLMNNGTSGSLAGSNSGLTSPTAFTGVNKEIKKSDAYKDLPDYIRIGKPIFYGVIPKLRELQLLEQLIPASKLNQVTQSQLVAVKIPPAAPPDEVMEIVRHFEEMLNPPTGMNMEQMQMTLAEVMNATGRMRIVPQFMDDKGALEPLNIRQDQNVDDLLNSIQDIRKIILTSIGIPPTLLFGADADGNGEKNKAQELHLQSRYTRRLNDLRFALAQGIKQIVFAHLVNKKMKVRKNDIDVVFTNAMVDFAGLERLEFDDMKQAIVNNLLTLGTTIFGGDTSVVASAIDKRNYIKWIKKQFDVLTDGESIFQDPEKLVFDQPAAMGGGPGGMGAGGAPMPMSDVGGTDMGGGSSSVPLPGGIDDGSVGGNPAGGGTPGMQGRMGQAAPGSGDVNVSTP